MPNAPRSVAPAAWRREGLGQAPAALDPAIAVGTAARPQSRGHRLPVGHQAAAIPLGLGTKPGCRGTRGAALYLGKVVGHRSAALVANLAYRGHLLKVFGFDGEARLLPSLEASLQSDCTKAPVSQHERRTGAGFFLESSAVGDDRGRSGQFFESVSESFGSDADCTCDSLMH